jgi:hypothetical protein
VSIATSRNVPFQRAGRHQQGDLTYTRSNELAGALRSGGTRGQDVVDQQNPFRWRTSNSTKRAPHRIPAVPACPCRLRWGLVDPREERDDGKSQTLPDHTGERPGLIVAALRFASSSQWHPRHRIGAELVRCRHGAPQGFRDGLPPRELQPVKRLPGRSAVREGRASRSKGMRRAFATTRNRVFVGTAAPPAPRRVEYDQSVAARPAERPGTATATRATQREDDVENRPKHGGNVAAPDDIKTTSSG